MTRITSNLLDDTLKVFQLARETARIQGQPVQAEKLTPLVDNLRNLVNESRETKATPVVPPSGGLLAQNDFKTLLSVVQNNQPVSNMTISQIHPSNALERNSIVSAMAMGGMGSLDIARQMGMTLNEVQMIISLNQKTQIGE